MKTIISSLDTTQPIYMNKESREEFFSRLYNIHRDAYRIGEYKNNKEFYKKFVNAEWLEDYCLGKTWLSDYAYSKIIRALIKEYEEWVKAKGYNLPEVNKRI